jgi:hypothetical protein
VDLAAMRDAPRWRRTNGKVLDVVGSRRSGLTRRRRGAEEDRRGGAGFPAWRRRGRRRDSGTARRRGHGGVPSRCGVVVAVPGGREAEAQRRLVARRRGVRGRRGRAMRWRWRQTAAWSRTPGSRWRVVVAAAGSPGAARLLARWRSAVLGYMEEKKAKADWKSEDDDGIGEKVGGRRRLEEGAGRGGTEAGVGGSDGGDPWLPCQGHVVSIERSGEEEQVRARFPTS